MEIPVKQKFLLKAGAALAVVAFGIFAYLLFTGPRMRTQINIRPFQAQMPAIPEGTVPVVDTIEPIPNEQQANLLTNPLAKTPENYARGKVYYGYYCVFCHGESGAGDGPVGYSYVPVPTDLRTSRVQSLSQGQLLRAMLAGTGHEPVLNRVVAPEHRWYLELYVRSLGTAGSNVQEMKD
jgi:hypothetical protein